MSFISEGFFFSPVWNYGFQRVQKYDVNTRWHFATADGTITVLGIEKWPDSSLMLLRCGQIHWIPKKVILFRDGKEREGKEEVSRIDYWWGIGTTGTENSRFGEIERGVLDLWQRIKKMEVIATTAIVYMERGPALCLYHLRLLISYYYSLITVPI